MMLEPIISASLPCLALGIAEPNHPIAQQAKHGFFRGPPQHIATSKEKSYPVRQGLEVRSSSTNSNFGMSHP
jgi:hypothetical protein